MDDRDGIPDPEQLRVAVIAALAIVALLSATDLYLDAPKDWWTPHVLIELSIVTLSIGFGFYLWAGWRRTAVGLGAANQSLIARNAEAAAWRAQALTALSGLGQAIDAQFTAWQLTPAERDVGLHLLRGLGHKQVAALTDRSERTVRQHAVALYQKSGLRGRAELAAFFLEGVELPSRR